MKPFGGDEGGEGGYGGKGQFDQMFRRAARQQDGDRPGEHAPIPMPPSDDARERRRRIPRRFGACAAGLRPGQNHREKDGGGAVVEQAFRLDQQAAGGREICCP